MAKKKVNALDLIQKIEKLTKERMTSPEVVQLDQFRDFRNKVEPRTILIIEDDETMRTALKRIFESDGLQTRLASDGTELSVIMDEITPDLILMDIGLPWINGFELAQLLKEHKEIKKIPLVFVSGQASDEDLKRAFAIGADDFIKKPFEIDKLRKTVQALLKINGS
ncbi:MAG: response regulator [Bdellovibrionaceae bacterium]|nr:response regulator [Pseudobdellovibrionaceae bacterium]